MDQETIKIIEEHYSNTYDEETRFTKDRSHSVEYLTSLRYIDKYLKKGDRILEIGAGTGAYSIHYASLGYKVDSVELVEFNLNILKSKITDNMDINAVKGNALDLNMFDDNTFDVTLLLGPMYHLFNEEDKIRALNEAKRVTKPNGIIFIAYLTSDSIFASYGLKKHHLLDANTYADNNYKVLDIPSELFTGFYIDEFKELVSKVGIKYINNISTDGIGALLAEYVNDLSDEEFNVWLDYHFKNCERLELQGYSMHMLYIGRKI